MASPFPPVTAAVKNIVSVLAGAPTTVVRKRDVVLARDTLPICIVSYGGETGEEWAVTGNGADNLGTIGKAYSVWISVYRTNLADLASSTTNPDFIDAAKEALNKGSLAGVSEVWNTELEAHEEWEGQDFKTAGEVSRFQLWFQTAEARNG